MEVKRTERGWAGHFCLGYRCEYHRNTLLEYNGKKVVVSTVGRLRKDFIRPGYDEIGCDRHFETMAFLAKNNDKYNDADISKEIVFESNWCLPRPDMELEAEEMHEAVVKEISERMINNNLEIREL